MSDWTAPGDEVDAPTRRLGRYIAIGAAVHFVAHLLGIGVDGVRVEILDPFVLVAALFLATGSVGARTALLAWYLVVTIIVVLAVLVSGRLLVILAVAVFGLPIAAMHVVAVAYTVATAPPALGLPEQHRAAATSQLLHALILGFALLNVFSTAWN